LNKLISGTTKNTEVTYGKVTLFLTLYARMVPPIRPPNALTIPKNWRRTKN